MIQVLTITEFLDLPKTAEKKTKEIRDYLNSMGNGVEINDKVIQNLVLEIEYLCELMLLIRKYKMKIPNLNYYRPFNVYARTYSLRSAALFEIFDLITSGKISWDFFD